MRFLPHQIPACQNWNNLQHLVCCHVSFVAYNPIIQSCHEHGANHTVHPTCNIFKSIKVWLSRVVRSSNQQQKRHQQWNKRSFLNTADPFQLLWSTRQSNMILMASRRRAAIKFPIECALFVNKKAHLNITSINWCYIILAPATMGTRRQTNGWNRISIPVYDNSGTAVCASTIKIPDGWTPQLCLWLLLQE